MLRSAVRALDERARARARVLAWTRTRRRVRNGDPQLMSFVMEDHQFLRATIDTIFALKGLERIGDHAKNIAEQCSTWSRRASGRKAPRLRNPRPDSYHPLLR